MIYDVILILIFIGFIIFNAVRGASKSLAGILISIASYISASFLGKFVSFKIYDAMLRPAVNNAVKNSVGNITDNAVSKAIEALPDWISGLVKTSGVDISGFLDGKLSGATESAGNALNEAIRPIAVDVMTCLLTLVLYLLIHLLLSRFLARPLLKVFRLPVIRTVDMLLGGVLGFVSAFLIVSLLAYLLKLLIPHIGSESGMLNESTIYNSFIFYHFYSGNIFTAITSWIK